MTRAPKAPRIVTADNPAPLTGRGTNTFLLGTRQIAVIDPGPDLPAHRQAILDAAGPGKITHILVTHAHLDHSEGAPALAKATGAQILAFGSAESGRSALMQRLAAAGELAGGEGLDHAFIPDLCLRDGDTITSEEWSLRALHTPGHSASHLSFQWDDQVFCGDLVMGWSSTLISPPDGDLADYFRSLARLEAIGAARLWPAHGDPVEAPADRIRELAAHRRERTSQILAALRDGPANAAELAARIYDIPPLLLPAAARNVLAHLVALCEIGALRVIGPLAHDAEFAMA